VRAGPRDAARNALDDRGGHRRIHRRENHDQRIDLVGRHHDPYRLAIRIRARRSHHVNRVAEAG
jgi:hypothetical protein